MWQYEFIIKKQAFIWTIIYYLHTYLFEQEDGSLPYNIQTWIIYTLV